MLIHNRLTVLGPSELLDEFEATDWLEDLDGHHPEIYESSRTRRTWWFQSSTPAHPAVVILSKTWPRLTFLLEFQAEDLREIGIAKVTHGRVDLCRLSY